MIAKGSFEVSMKAEPPYDIVDGVTLARASFEKKFEGPLTAQSVVNMIAVRTPVADSAGYVAAERIVGTLEGKQGTFALIHHGLMDHGKSSLVVDIVPNSGTGELASIAGRMDIQIVEGKHFYTLDYSLG